MYKKIIVFTILLQGLCVKAIDINSIFGRFVCFDNNVQKGCSRTFLEEYPQLSRSVTNMTVADTFMLLYTRHSTEPENLHLCGGRLPPNSKFNPKNEVFVIFNPYIFSFCNVAILREWVVQLLIRGDYNVIVIDYSWGNQVDVGTAELNARTIVKNQTVILLNNIQEQIGVPFVHLTLIGHSLAGQLVGMVGAFFPVDRIIVGINYLVGHVNFFINGGTWQNSCHNYVWTSLMKKDYLYGFLTLLVPTECPHCQCTQYLKVSINPGGCQYVGVRCRNKSDYELGKCRSCGANGENCLIMGFDTERYIKRIPSEPELYFVDTSDDCSYCDNRHVKLGGYRDTYTASLQSC